MFEVYKSFMWYKWSLIKAFELSKYSKPNVRFINIYVTCLLCELLYWIRRQFAFCSQFPCIDLIVYKNGLSMLWFHEMYDQLKSSVKAFEIGWPKNPFSFLSLSLLFFFFEVSFLFGRSKIRVFFMGNDIFAPIYTISALMMQKWQKLMHHIAPIFIISASWK